MLNCCIMQLIHKEFISRFLHNNYQLDEGRGEKLMAKSGIKHDYYSKIKVLCYEMKGPLPAGC